MNLKQIKNIQQQNNYSNQILHTIATQLDHVEISINHISNYISLQNPKIQKDKIKLEQPIFKPFSMTQEELKTIKLGNSNEELLKEIK